MKSVWKKLIALGAIVAAFAVGYGIDSIVASTYDLEVIAVERQEETPALDEEGNPIPADIGIADGQTIVHFTIRLTRGDDPIEGHTLYVKTNRNVLARVVTDESGQAVVSYKCYRARKSAAAEPIILTVTDEDNSVLITVPAKTEYTLQMRKPVDQSDDGMKTDDVFYPIGTNEKGGDRT